MQSVPPREQERRGAVARLLKRARVWLLRHPRGEPSLTVGLLPRVAPVSEVVLTHTSLASVICGYLDLEIETVLLNSDFT